MNTIKKASLKNKFGKFSISNETSNLVTGGSYSIICYSKPKTTVVVTEPTLELAMEVARMNGYYNCGLAPF